ncbi:hypothetical protein [Alsobacter sp. R-9]
MSVEIKSYRQHVIKARTQGVGAAAVVLRSGRMIFRIDARTVDEAFVMAGARLDEMLADRRAARRCIKVGGEDCEVGTIDEFVEMLSTLQTSEVQRKMLLAHANATDRSLTSRGLSEAVWGQGASHTNTNLHYGTLGSAMAAWLEIRLPTYGTKKELKTCAIAQPIPGSGGPDSPDWLWRMHDELAVAIERTSLRAS